MLEYLRNAADKPLAKFLMFVLIFSFVGWGVADWIFSGGSTQTTLVNIGNSQVSEQQFNMIYSNGLQNMPKDKSKNIRIDPVENLQYKKKILADLVRSHLILNRSEDLGFVVTDKRIAEVIAPFASAIPDYMLEQYIANIHAQMLEQMTVGTTMELPFEVPEFMVDAAYNARYATRDIKYDTIKFDSMKVNNPTDEELQTYYAQNPHMVPETRSVSYIFVDDKYSGGDVMEEIEMEVLWPDESVKGDPMKAAATAHKAKFVQVPHFKRGDKVSDKIMSDPDIVDIVFSMNVGFSKESYETNKGLVLIRVDDIIPEHNAELKDIKKDLISGWKKAEQRKQAYVKANEKLVDLNKDGSLKNVKTKSVTRTDGAPLAVLNAAFAGKIGENTIVEDGDAFYVLHVEKNTAPKQNAKKKDGLRKELQNLSKDYLSEDYMNFLKREYKVKYNDAAYKRSVGQ